MELPKVTQDLVRKLVSKESGPDHLILAVLYEDMHGHEALKSFCKTINYDIEAEYLRVQINLKISDEYGNPLPEKFSDFGIEDDMECAYADECTDFSLNFEEQPHILESELMNILDCAYKSSGSNTKKPVVYESELRQFHGYDDPDEPLIDMSWRFDIQKERKPTMETDSQCSDYEDRSLEMDYVTNDVSDSVIDNVYNQMISTQTARILTVDVSSSHMKQRGVKRKHTRSAIVKQKFRKLVLGAPRGTDLVRSDCLVVDRKISARTREVLTKFKHSILIEEICIKRGKCDKIAFFVNGTGEQISEFNVFLNQDIENSQISKIRRLTVDEQHLGLNFVGPGNENIPDLSPSE